MILAHTQTLHMRNCRKNSIFWIIDFHWLLANQWDFEVNREHIRVPQFETQTAEHFPTNSIFIGFRLTNQVSHAIEVRFGFAMLDNLLFVVPGAEICLSVSMQRSNELVIRCHIYIHG
jgi:hypothetical protein